MPKSKEQQGTVASAESEPLELAPSGSQRRVLQDLDRYMAAPDLPMVNTGLAGQIANTRNMDVAPSRMFDDGGKRLQVIQYLARRGKEQRFPKTREALFDALESFFTFCGDNQVPVTLGGFAVWNGVSVQRVNQIERDHINHPELSAAVSVAKDAIRTFLELSAIDSALNPIVYFHMNKVYYGAVENQQVTVRVEDNTTELTPDEIEARRRMLIGDSPVTMECDGDGVFRAASE